MSNDERLWQAVADALGVLFVDVLDSETAPTGQRAVQLDLFAPGR